MLTPDDLRPIAAFDGLADDELAWLVDHMEEVCLEAGEVLFRQGEPAERMVVLFEGAIHGRPNDKPGAPPFVTQAGEVSGMLPHSRMETWGGTGRAVVDSRGATLHKDHFAALFRAIPALEERLVAVMSDRIRETTRMGEQRERLVSLGTLAAGLAHELNNPASAARRSAHSLADTLQAFDTHASHMLKTVIFHEEKEGDPFEPLYNRMQIDGPGLGALEQSEREDELTDWLGEVGVEEPWDAAATFVSVGYTRDMLEGFMEQIVPEHVPNVLRWMPQDIEMRLLARELIESTTRISDLVTAMKSYSYMDRAADKAPTDVHDGLDTTLTILNHKLKHKGVVVVRDYSEALSRVPANGGELNQVWTNLLDNAVAAAPEEGGQIRIETRLEHGGEAACITIIDNGSGIPEEIQPRIFEPFFTTKAAGEGTGLGLDVTYRIIKGHNGSLSVTSEPGETRFQVRLPLENNTEGE